MALINHLNRPIVIQLAGGGTRLIPSSGPVTVSMQEKMPFEVEGVVVTTHSPTGEWSGIPNYNNFDTYIVGESVKAFIRDTIPEIDNAFSPGAVVGTTENGIDIIEGLEA